MNNTIIEYIDEQMRFNKGILSESGLLRELFDPISSQWNSSDIDTKLDALKILAIERDENIIELMLGIMKI